jgi:hypothetical protein
MSRKAIIDGKEWIIISEEEFHEILKENPDPHLGLSNIAVEFKKEKS